MPIRMEKDSPDNQGPSRRPGGGNNPLLKLLPFILLFVFKKPKIGIPILIIGGLIWYFGFGGGQAFLSGDGGFAADDPIDPEEFSLGASFDQQKYDTTQVFAALAYGYGNYNQLPPRFTLEEYIPQRRHQGRQGSCVGWASAYAARTILEAQATGKAPDQVAFSPAYLYNQIHLDGCQGAYMLDAMRSMQQNGGLPFQQFQYTDQTCSNYPSGRDIQEGRRYKIKEYNRLTKGANNYQVDIDGIKQNLAQGAPVVIGMMVGGSFMNRMRGQQIWQPNSRDYSMQGFGGHAMCVIGYDDQLAGGSFQVMNSWGEDWGDEGLFWVRYKDFLHFTKEAYGIAPLGRPADNKKYDDSRMAVEFGLLDVAKRATIPLRQVGDISFRTTRPLSSDDKFKVLIANSIECYIYVFGQETDGSSYVLFPYTSKHSPYCGITGTRLFPQDFSMSPDEIGQRDYIAIVITKDDINYESLNSSISRSRQSTYAEKVKEALSSMRIRTVDFKSGNTISFEADRQGRNAVGMVIEIDKR